MSSTTTTAAITLAAATAAAGTLTYAALSAQSQLFGKILIAPRNPNEIALTYDDGPNDIVTERLLELLARHNVRASFFLIGNYVRQRPQIARAIAASGHLIGNHTMTHPWLAWQSYARIRQELTDCNAILEDTLGIPILTSAHPTERDAPRSSASLAHSASSPFSGTSCPKTGSPSAQKRSQRVPFAPSHETRGKTAPPTSFSTMADKPDSANPASPP